MSGGRRGRREKGRGIEEGRWNGNGRGGKVERIRGGERDEGSREGKVEETGGYIDQSYNLHSQWVQCQSGRWWK